MPEIVAEYIDRLVCTVEIRFRSGLPRGVTLALYEAARRVQGAPLTYLAATRLREQVRPGSHVLIVTGAGAPPGLPRGETDGPPGAAAIARAVDWGMGGKPVIVTEARHVAPIAASVEALGVAIVDVDTFQRRSHTAVMETLPTGLEADRVRAVELFDRYRPVAAVFIEKGGPNEAGVYHSILGTGRGPDVMANAFHLVELARVRQCLTVGIGDGGNEIGFGLIRETVQEVQPFGRRCQCPCGKGIATITATDVLVAASISNWGAYGVVACLSHLLGRPEVLHTEEMEHVMLERCVAAGGEDGAYGAPLLMVDGTWGRTQEAVITLLRNIVANGLTDYTRGF
ncbi:MAG: glutamate cyclase domain-containing protein [Armatimonadota bacterium]